MRVHQRYFYLLIPLFLATLFLLMIRFGAGYAQNQVTEIKEEGKKDPPYSANIEIIVEDNFGNLIPGAEITIHELGIEASTDRNGKVFLEMISMPKFSMWITLTVNAEGFGEWKMENLLLVHQDILRINPELEINPIHKVLPGMNRESYQQMSLGDWEGFQQFLDKGPETLTVPAAIRVRVTGDWHCDTSITYTVQIVDFNFYVKHVLPSEWNSGEDEVWPDESYRAGAMAVKMYAWYWISQGGKWDDADVYDSTCDQLYNPEYSREFTDKAVDYTWDWNFTRDKKLFPTYYRSTEEYNCPPGVCMSQWGSKAMAESGYTWDDILHYYYTNTLLYNPRSNPAGWALEFNGTSGDIGENRILIPLDDPATTEPGPPVDIGAEDFTIEWWMKTEPDQNYSSTITVTCGETMDWIFGNILFDRYLPQHPGYGVSLSDGRIVFGVNGQNISDTMTICGSTSIDDGLWHHIAVQRRIEDGFVWTFVDGKLDASSPGPSGDISYPDTLTPTLPSQDHLAIGGWRNDDNHDQHPFYRGWMDEIRLSNILRYTESFTVSETVFQTDNHTVALYNFDEKLGNKILDSSGAEGGPSDGIRAYGGTINGPERWPSSLFVVLDKIINLPIVYKQGQ